MKLHITVESLSVIGLNGSFGSPIDASHVHIEVVKRDHFPSVANTDIHFDGNNLRCTGLNVGVYDLRLFATTSGDVIASTENQPNKMMDPDQTAEFIMKRMVESVKRPARL